MAEQTEKANGSATPPFKAPGPKPHQAKPSRPALQSQMRKKPKTTAAAQRGSGKLALSTDADRDFGQAVAVAFAQEGADIAGFCLDKHDDAKETARLVEAVCNHRGAPPGQPNDVTTCFVFLPSGMATYMTGQILHPNGGKIING